MEIFGREQRVKLVAQTGDPVEYPVKDSIPYFVEGSVLASLVMLLLFNVAFPAIKAALASGNNESKRVDSLITWQQNQYTAMLARMEANSALLMQTSELVRASAENIKDVQLSAKVQREALLELTNIVKDLAEEVKQMSSKRQY